MKKSCFPVVVLMIVATLPCGAQTDSATQFKRMCTLCHGMDGKANTAMGRSLKAADLTATAVQSQTDAQIYEVIARGKGKMAAYEGILGKEGVRSMVKYIRTLAPPKKK
jgi:mono/diheme cytochrome c family protein